MRISLAILKWRHTLHYRELLMDKIEPRHCSSSNRTPQCPDERRTDRPKGHCSSCRRHTRWAQCIPLIFNCFRLPGEPKVLPSSPRCLRSSKRFTRESRANARVRTGRRNAQTSAERTDQKAIVPVAADKRAGRSVYP